MSEKTIPEIAREALEVLDRDGWCRGTTQQFKADGTLGAHCLGGAVNIALHGNHVFIHSSSIVTSFEGRMYSALMEKVSELYNYSYNAYHPCTSHLVRWNDSHATEADVRTVLEKLAADEV